MLSKIVIAEMERLAGLRKENRYRIVWRTTLEIIELDNLQKGQVDINGRTWISEDYWAGGFWRYPVILPIVRPGIGMSSWPPPPDLR